MYRTNDPRFRRRLNELGQTLESANETAQSGIYIFSHNYIEPCLSSIGSCLTTCVDASCPSLNLSANQRQRARARGRARSRGRAELSFDFYDDWDEEGEADGLLGGWGNEEFDRLVAGSGAGTGGGYGTVGAQPGRQRGMSYPHGRRKSAHVEGQDALTGKGLFGRLFGKAKAVRYKPSAADLQEHPGARRLAKDPEGEALLEESEEASAQQGRSKRRGRTRSDTVGSRETQDSFSSRGDIFPSDEEDDAIPLDDEFAMVLERRNTGTHSGPETESSSNKTRSLKRGKRPSAGSRVSSRRTLSSRSTRSSTGKRVRSRGNSSAAQTPVEEEAPRNIAEHDSPQEVEPPTLEEITQEDRELAQEEEAEIERKRSEAQRAAEERGLAEEQEHSANAASAANDVELPSLSGREVPRQHSISPPPPPDEEADGDDNATDARDDRPPTGHDEDSR